MRRTIPITTTRPGKPDEIRLFTMNDHQAQLYERAVVGIVRGSDLPLWQATHVVENTVAKMLGGKMPPESAPALFHQMRIAFPILRKKQIKELPRHGCPSGRITSIVLGVSSAAKSEHRTVRVDLDDDQANWHRDAMELVMSADECTKDEAWVFVNNLIGNLLGGAELNEDADMLITRGRGLFPVLTDADWESLPQASEDDVRRWCFTRDRER
jgi:hypothetical protein